MNRQNRTEWFKRLAERLSGYEQKTDDLIAQVRMEERVLPQIKDAARRYLLACLKKEDQPLSDEALLSLVEGSIDRLANRTPNGILLAKQEFEQEFNEFHRVVASWLKGLQLDPLIDQVFCPIILRVVKPKAASEAVPDPAVSGNVNRPYDSTKLHVDLWNGDPADNINLLIPLWGDVEATTIEFFRPPDDFEERLLRVINDYSEGEKLLGPCEPYPIRFTHGFAHFCDAVVLHRTVKKPGGRVRISIQFELRRKTSEQTKAEVSRLAMPERLKSYIDLKTWYELGTRKFMQFKDTFADAERGIIAHRPYLDETYRIVDTLETASPRA
ncbi:MAG: hypothetical protein HY211_05945 [Candidatus Omnitrophica bacterium]|nr:hypothetical protein [Candidatus Omnitrophota bacterium]